MARVMRLAREANLLGMNAQHGLEAFEMSAEQGRTNRRSFLKGVGLVGSLLALEACKSRDFNSSVSSNKSDDRVAILGGGVAGLTTAFHLARNNVGCTIYEGSERIGGRIYTKFDFIKGTRGNQFCELGAELVDSTNEELLSLKDMLNQELKSHPEFPSLMLQTEDFVKDETDTKYEMELFYFGGRVRTARELFLGMRGLIASVDKDIKQMFPSGQTDAITYLTNNSPAMEKFDRMTLAQYFDSKKDLAESWVINAFRGSYLTEYGGDLDKQSALNFLLLADTDLTDAEFTWYGASDEAMRIKGGNERIIKALLAYLHTKRDLVDIQLGHKLSHIATNGSRLTLGFSSGKTVQVPRAVCCLPFSTLRGVDGIGALGIKSKKMESIKNFQYGMNSKFMVGFNNRFWREGSGTIPKMIGTVTTDLPIGMFWETSRLQTQGFESGILTNFLGGQVGATVTEARLDTILKDLKTIYSVSDASRLKPVAHVLQAWPQLPWSKGSYSCPAPGAYTSYLGIEREPELEGKLLFAGEHVSYEWMGFMNGAIQSANLAAARILGDFNLVPFAQAQIKARRRWKSRRVSK